MWRKGPRAHYLFTGRWIYVAEQKVGVGNRFLHNQILSQFIFRASFRKELLICWRQHCPPFIILWNIHISNSGTIGPASQIVREGPASLKEKLGACWPRLHSDSLKMRGPSSLIETGSANSEGQPPFPMDIHSKPKIAGLWAHHSLASGFDQTQTESPLDFEWSGTSSWSYYLLTAEPW